MGLFSSKTKTTVATSVMRVIDNNNLPQSTKAGTIKALLNNGDIPEYIAEDLISSIGIRAESMYRYAEKSYVYGLPSGEVYGSTQGKAQVEAVIEAMEGQQVLLSYSNFGPPNTLHIGWMQLVSQYGYNAATNELPVLSAQKGFPVYLDDMVVVIPDNLFDSLSKKSLEQWGTSARAGYTPDRTVVLGLSTKIKKPSAVVRSETATEIHLAVTYVWNTAAPTALPVVLEGTVNLPVTGFDDKTDYFHAKYVVGNQTKYWIYKNKSGTYPSLDAVFEQGQATAGSYFPFAYFRYNKASVISDKTTPAYRTSKRLVKFIGMDYDTVAEGINSNPDIADVEQAMMVMAIPPVSTNALDNRYLFEYFDNMYYSMGEPSGSDTTESIRRGFIGSLPAQNVQIIRDALFQMALSNDGIYKRLVAGSVGPVGTHTSAYSFRTESTDYLNQKTGAITPQYFKIALHTYCKQITEAIYEEITVHNLTMTYYVFGDYTTTGGDTDAILLIPIDRLISQHYSIGEREQLYARSMHFVFNSRIITKLKWYQTGIFQVITFIVSIAITYFYPPAGLAAMGLQGTALLVAVALLNIVVSVVVNIAYKLFIKVFGADFARLVSLVAILYSGFKIIKAGGIAGAPWAKELIGMANGLHNAAMAAKMQDLVEDYSDFKLLADAKTKELETSKELLESNNHLTPLGIIWNSPDEMYNSTVHSGNIGILSINAISSYVDIALTLPTVNETLGEKTYV